MELKDFHNISLNLSKILLSFLLWMGINAVGIAQENIQLIGKIEQRPWSKTGQSYCAQGSDYWVLVGEQGEEYVLEINKKLKINTHLDKVVTIQGYIKEKRIEFNDNVPNQHPVSYNPVTGKTDNFYTCEVFVVVKIL